MSNDLPDIDVQRLKIRIAELEDERQKLERSNHLLGRALNDAAMIRRILDKRIEAQRKVNAGLHRSYEETVAYLLSGKLLMRRMIPLTKGPGDAALLLSAHCWLKESPTTVPSTELRTRLEALNRDAVGADGNVRRMIDPREIAKVLTETLGVAGC